MKSPRIAARAFRKERFDYELLRDRQLTGL